MVESGERPESGGQVAEVVARLRLAVQVPESFPLAGGGPSKLVRMIRGGVLIGGQGELGVEPQGGRAFGVAEAAGDGVQIGA